MTFIWDRIATKTDLKVPLNHWLIFIFFTIILVFKLTCCKFLCAQTFWLSLTTHQTRKIKRQFRLRFVHVNWCCSGNIMRIKAHCLIFLLASHSLSLCTTCIYNWVLINTCILVKSFNFFFFSFSFPFYFQFRLVCLHARNTLRPNTKNNWSEKEQHYPLYGI